MSQVMQVARPETRRHNLQVTTAKPLVCADCRFAQLWAVHGGADCTRSKGAPRAVPAFARACEGGVAVDPALTDLHCVTA